MNDKLIDTSKVTEEVTEIPEKEPTKESAVSRLSPEEIRDIATLVSNKVMQQTQSRTAKLINTVNESVQAQLDNLKAAGITVEQEKIPALVEETRRRVQNKFDAELLDEKPEPTTADPASQANAQANQYVEKLEKKYGFAIEEGDDEFKSLDTSSPPAFIHTQALALEHKKNRLLQEQEQEATQGASERLTLSASGGTGKSTANSPELDIQELEKLQANPTPANKKRRMELRARVASVKP